MWALIMAVMLLQHRLPAFLRARTCQLTTGRCLAAPERNLYDVLGVTPRASTKQIKAAYFRLSKKHHPDRKSGDSITFQQISAAYEVLGSRSKRRAYDMSLSTGGGGLRNVRHQQAAEGRGPAPTGRTAHFDYDTWSKMHYREVRNRASALREEFEIKKNNQAHREESRRASVCLCLIMMAMVVYIGVGASVQDRQELRRACASDRDSLPPEPGRPGG